MFDFWTDKLRREESWVISKLVCLLSQTLLGRLLSYTCPSSWETDWCPRGMRVETHLGHWFSMYRWSSNGLYEQKSFRPGGTMKTIDSHLVLVQHAFSDTAPGWALENQNFPSPLYLSLYCLYIFTLQSFLWALRYTRVHTNTHEHVHTCTCLAEKPKSTWTKNPLSCYLHFYPKSLETLQHTMLFSLLISATEPGATHTQMLAQGTSG